MHDAISWLRAVAAATTGATLLAMDRSTTEDLLHRVNNLLSTITTQVEVAAVLGTLEAHQDALRMIAESANKTHEEVRRFRSGGDVTAQ